MTPEEALKLQTSSAERGVLGVDDVVARAQEGVLVCDGRESFLLESSTSILQNMGPQRDHSSLA